MTTYRYQVVNSQWQTVPVNPFSTIAEAKQHILGLLETYPGPFHVIELAVVHTQEK